MLVLVLVLVLVLALVLVLVAPVTVHALRRSRFLVPPCSKLDVIRIFANRGTKDNAMAKARGRVARRAVGYSNNMFNVVFRS